MTLWTEIMMSQSLFQNTFILKKPKSAIFDDIIKMRTIFIKNKLKTKLKEFCFSVIRIKTIRIKS